MSWNVLFNVRYVMCYSSKKVGVRVVGGFTSCGTSLMSHDVVMRFNEINA
jgi:hypothetical protein